jgi:hypothetical protein
MSRPDFLCAIHAEDDFVREPVGAEIHHGGEHERHHHALLTAGQIAYQQQHAAQRAEQQCGLHSVRHDVILLRFLAGDPAAGIERTPWAAQEFPDRRRKFARL